MAAEATCSWWRQELHFYRRRRDLIWWASLVAVAGDMHMVNTLFAAVITLPGFEAWQCPCGRQVAQALRAVGYRVEAATDGEEEADGGA